MQRLNPLKRKLAAGKTTYGLWVSLESPTITEIACELRLDWVVVDVEHGHMDFKEVVDHLRVVRNTDTAGLVRIQEIEKGLIKRLLDIGAEGLIVPQIDSPDEIREAIRFAKYPPAGVRGVGVERSTKWGLDLAQGTRRANDETLIIPMIETVAAGNRVEEIVAIGGIDAIFFGPADYCASSGYLGEWNHPQAMERMMAIQARVRAAGIPCGILTTSVQEARLRRDQGFSLLALGTDAGQLIRGVKEMKEGLESG
jgi:2-keto-3-deoxy-L-rhamnonate aldolase RhmA